ncbi:MAG: T9SS type A sorting domain-containing protein [Cryomorphaceae bacterium]|nr:T9SS type A sorting domain-containing protein [Cryomorphaceae bacterium]
MLGFSFNLNAQCFQTVVPYEVTSWEKWDANNPPPSNAEGRSIIVKSHNRLTIEGITIEMPQMTGILLEPGAKLVLDNATITNCAGYFDNWDGITVEGNRFMPQSNMNQGQIEMKNGSTIEHATDAVVLKDGAFISAENSTFRNNGRDVDIWPYKNPVLSVPTSQGQPTFLGYYKNATIFKDVEFLTDENLIISQIHLKPSITLNNTTLVRFLGCKFEDERDFSNPNYEGDNKRNGINAVKSAIKVDEFLSEGDEIGDGTPTEFTNLNYAIRLLDNGVYRTSKVQRCIFYLNRRSIYINNNDQIEIINNSFSIRPGIFHYKSFGFGMADYGVYVDHSQNFTVRNNDFLDIPIGQGANGNFGLIVRESKSSDELFNKNYFKNMTVASEALGANVDQNDIGGLTFRCNRYEECENDFVVQEDIFYYLNNRNPFDPSTLIGVDKQHGNEEDFPSNEFSEFANYNIFNGYALNDEQTSFRQLEYWIANEQVGTEYEPNAISNFVNVKSGDIEDFEPDCDPIGTFMVGHVLNNYYPIIETKKTVWATLIDDDRTQQLNTDIMTATPATAVTVYNDLMGISPWLSQEVLATLAAFNEHFTDEQVRDVMVVNPTAGRSLWVQTELENATFPIDTAYITEIRAAALNFTERDSFEAVFSQEIKTYSYALRGGIQEYRNDTIHSTQDLDPYMRHPTDKSYHYKLVDFYVEEYNFDSAYSIMNQVDNTFDLTNWEQEGHNAKLDFITKLEEWEQEENIEMYDTSTDRKVWLLNYISNQTRPVMEAFNLLTLYGIDSLPDDHVYLPDSEEEAEMITGLEELVLEGEFKINSYPNPASDYFRLELKGKVEENQSIFVQVMNLKGQKVAIKRWQNPNDALELNTTSFRDGVYIVQVVTEKEVLGLTKIIISK